MTSVLCIFICNSVFQKAVGILIKVIKFIVCAFSMISKKSLCNIR